MDTVPYTKRKRSVILFDSIQESLENDDGFEQMSALFEGNILDAEHPLSVRVRLIAQNIIESLQKERTNGDDSLRELSHLRGLKWEVVVVDKPEEKAFCFRNGKIVVFTGVLQLCSSDAEIAAIIGHEVAHIVARHPTERIVKDLWFMTGMLVLMLCDVPLGVFAMSCLFAILLKLEFSRRREMEADYIGLMLIASAGYDPRVAPEVYEKLDEVVLEQLGLDGLKLSYPALIDFLFTVKDCFSTHPHWKKRAQLLAEAEVMEEAMLIYREVQAEKGGDVGTI